MKTILFKAGETTKLNDDGLLEINIDEVKSTYCLQKILDENLGKFTEKIEIDRDSYRNLKFCFSDLERDLVLASVHSTATFVSFTMKKEEDVKKDIKEWVLIGKDWSSEVKNILESMEATKRLQNTPPNFLMPENFVDAARELLKGLEGVEIVEIKGKQLTEERLELIKAVGRASEYEPRLLILKYTAPNSNDLIALVGKGVCYDSGGLNIKTGSYMSSMKFDMSGGAVSLGVINALARNKSKQSVVIAVPLVENAVAGHAYRPDDVVVCRNGMSIEIDNTDAEGRLVLADALAYVTDVYKPKEVITIATLTGSIGYALGSKYAGAWATSDEQWNKLWESSSKSSEWIWRMPMDDYYLKALKKTRIADIKNSTRSGAGGCNRAARFLKEFTDGLPYIHLDIANIDHCENTGEPTAPLFKTLYFYLWKQH